MNKIFYITTPIYYVNAKPHIGHAYTTIAADVATRFYKLLGWDTRMQTGTDEHGDKIAQAAIKKGIPIKKYVDQTSSLFYNTWASLNIIPDYFIRTTDTNHILTVQAILQKIFETGDIYLSSYSGNYCTGCERFLTNKELVNGKCSDHNLSTKYIEEENYFFKMKSYSKLLINHIKNNPLFIQPERYKNEVLAMLHENIDDLCISRPKIRLNWGIDLPFDNRFVTYVWFDALINYISGLGWPNASEFTHYWPTSQHLIGKDILKPHGIYWPTILMALGKAEGKPLNTYLYQRLNVHGYWKIENSKMSKSIGNVINPLEIIKIYGPDVFRYFVIREMVFGLDANFNKKSLIDRYNADLANNLGNLFSRIINMLYKYKNGIIPYPDKLNEIDLSLYSLSSQVQKTYEKNMHNFHFHLALTNIWNFINEINRYIANTEPWSLTTNSKNNERLDTILHTLLVMLIKIAIKIWPIMPKTSQIIAEHIGFKQIGLGSLKYLSSKEIIKPGILTKNYLILFPRINNNI